MPAFLHRFRKMGIPTKEKSAKTLPSVVEHSVRPMDAGEFNTVCGHHGWSGILCADKPSAANLTNRLCTCIRDLGNSTNCSLSMNPEFAYQIARLH